MAKVIFTVKYEIVKEKRTEYLDVVRELKNLLKSEGLESYSVYEVKSKENHFEEVYVYENKEAWENADNEEDERLDLLMTKLSDMIIDKTTQYQTLFEVLS